MVGWTLKKTLTREKGKKGSEVEARVGRTDPGLHIFTSSASTCSLWHSHSFPIALILHGLQGTSATDGDKLQATSLAVARAVDLRRAVHAYQWGEVCVSDSQNTARHNPSSSGLAMGHGGAGGAASSDGILPVILSVQVVSTSLEFRVLLVHHISLYKRSFLLRM
ncbi:hypothetical protein L1049_025948 [Liquidambar formosana]|uniref:Uncharacterized protein n=1 Tax=Liquidambar formosana TaxID=63359 RepID=A0AAP0NFH2_LIQFO